MRHLGVLATFVIGCSGTLDQGGGGDDTPPATDVEVRVADGNVPQSGVRVFFQNPDDSLIAETVTDATGSAKVAMTAGNVTVLRLFPAPTLPDEPARTPELYTYVGVAAGDVLELGDPVVDADVASPSAILVKVPETAQGTITVMTPCGQGQGTAPLIPVTVYNCKPDMILYVMDGNGGSFVMRAPYSENIDVSLGSFQEPLSSSISATNVQPNTAINVEMRLVLDDYTLFSSGQKRVDQTPQNVDLPQLDAVDELQLVAFTDGLNRTQMVATRSVYERGTTTVDGARMALLPYVETPDYSPTGISWVESGGGIEVADAVYATLVIQKDTGEALPGPNDLFTHAIIAPHGVSPTLKMPLLPPSISNMNAGATDQISGSLGLVLSSNGYDSLRGKVFRYGSILETTEMSSLVVLSYAGGTPPGI
jgi:hypothetical protein